MPAIRSPTIMQFCTNYYVYESIEQHISPHFKRTNLSTYMNSCPRLELTLRAHLSLLVLTSLTPSTPIIDKHYSLYYSISKDKFLPILHSPSIRTTTSSSSSYLSLPPPSTYHVNPVHVERNRKERTRTPKPSHNDSILRHRVSHQADLSPRRGSLEKRKEKEEEGG